LGGFEERVSNFDPCRLEEKQKTNSETPGAETGPATPGSGYHARLPRISDTQLEGLTSAFRSLAFRSLTTDLRSLGSPSVRNSCCSLWERVFTTKKPRKDLENTEEPRKWRGPLPFSALRLDV
jgi:hypothetical protein